MWTVFRVLLALAAFYVAYRGELLLEGRVFITQGAGHFLVAALLLIAADLRRSAATATREDGAAERWTALGWWGLLLVAFGLGCFYRLHLIASAPWGVWFDEAQNGLVAQRILNDPSYRPVFIGELSQLPALFFYLFAASVKLLGANVVAVRAVTTLAGMLTLVFIYLLARELFDQPMAVLSTLFLAVMRWHVNFSRFGMHGIFMPLFMTATFYFLVRGLKAKGFLNFAAAGVMAGVGLQGYYSFLLVPVIVALHLLHYVIFQRAISWGRLVAGVLVLGIMTAVVYAPVGLYAINNPGHFNQRLGTVSITKDRTPQQIVEVLGRTTSRHLLMFNSTGDGNGRHNIPGAPMLDTYTGLLFVLGIGYSLWRWRDSGYFLLLAWAAVIIQAGIWSLEFEAPQGYRTVGLTPAVAMLAAVPLALVWRLAAEGIAVTRPGRWPLRIASYAAAAAVVVVMLFGVVKAAYTNFDAYFHQQLRRADAWASYSTDATFVGKEVARLGSNYVVYCSPFLAGLPTITFLAPHAPEPRRFEAARDLPVTDTKAAAFLLSHAEQPAFDLIKSYYPNGKFVEFGPPDGGAPIVLEAILSAQDIEATRGLIYQYRNRHGSREGRVDALDLNWNATAPPLPPPFEAQWLGLLKAPTYGAYSLELRTPGTAAVYLDGKLVASGEGTIRAAQLSLAQGLHDLKVQTQVQTPGAVQLSWQRNGLPLVPVPNTQWFSAPVRRQGLEGSYFSDIAGEGLKFVRIDPFPGGHMHILPLAIPFSIRWRGQVEVPSAGTYRFIVQAVDEGSLSIDGKHLVTTPAPNQTADAAMEMTQGRHEIEILYHQRGGSPTYVNTLWMTPKGGPEIIPASLLSPPR